MPKRYINITEVVKNGKKYFRARLNFDFDKELGYKPEPKDFYGDTKEAADRKRSEYVPEKRLLDKKTLFIDYVEHSFITQQEHLAEAREQSWMYFEATRSRLRRFLISPTHQAIKDCLIRKVMLGAIDPVHIHEYFEALNAAKVSRENKFRLKMHIKAILESARHRIPHKLYEYMDGLKVKSLEKRTRPIKTFTVETVYQVVNDLTKPIEYRCLVAFLFCMQCRPQEMFALEWDDIDLEVGMVTFYKKVVLTKKGWVVEDGTKIGAKGVRTVAMPKFLVAMLKQHKDERAKITAPPFVFLTNYNQTLNKERWKDFWNGSEDCDWIGVRAILGLPEGPTFYSLKHLGNSFALTKTKNYAAQAEKMGHTTDRMARENYRMLFSAEKQEAADVFDMEM